MVTVVFAARQPLRVVLTEVDTHRPVQRRPTRGMAGPGNRVVTRQVSSRFLAWASIGVGIVVINVIALLGTVVWWMAPPACRWLNTVCPMGNA